MTQTNQNKVGILLPNGSSPIYDSIYPLGNRGAGSGTLIARADWSLHGITPTALPAYSGATWDTWGSFYSTTSNYLQGDYPSTTGDGNATGGVVVYLYALNIDEVYIEFEAQLPSAKEGCKFCKVFGLDGDGITTFDYANSTYQLLYNGGEFYEISYGDGNGSQTGNDNAQVLRYDGSNPEYNGRNYGVASISTPNGAGFNFDGNWHTFRIRHKYNSGTTLGTEVRDGAYFVSVDGTTLCNATNMFNRHYSNPPIIKQIAFGDWTQNTNAFTIRYRNIKISTGGFV